MTDVPQPGTDSHVPAHAAAQDTTEGHPVFAYAFRGDRRQALRSFEEFDAATKDADFLWVHLDLRDAAAQAWLRSRPWPRDVIEMVSAPIQRGRLLSKQHMIYGHLRDCRDQPAAVGPQAGALYIVASADLVVTGRFLPLLSLAEVQRRIEAGTVLLASPFAFLTGYLRALNDIGEGLLQKASERLGNLESMVLRREGLRHRDEILEIRRTSIQVAHDMAYRRTAMFELEDARPAPFPADEYERFNRQIHRYAALVDDAEDYADHCQFLLGELRAQVEEKTNQNIYILTIFSAIFLPATLIASIWGMNVGGIPFGNSSHGFWLLLAFFALFGGILLRFFLKLL
jgi:zinc transporter